MVLSNTAVSGRKSTDTEETHLLKVQISKFSSDQI